MSECLLKVNIIEYQQWGQAEYLSTASPPPHPCGALTKLLSIAFTLVKVNSESGQVASG